MAKAKNPKTLVRKAGITQKTHNKKRQSYSGGSNLMDLIVAKSYLHASSAPKSTSQQAAKPAVEVRSLGTPAQQHVNASRMARVAHVTRSVV